MVCNCLFLSRTRSKEKFWIATRRTGKAIFYTRGKVTRNTVNTVNDRISRILQYDLSGLGCWLTFLAIALLASSVGLGWLVNGFFILIAVAAIAPVVIFFGLQWWLKLNFVQDSCPVCSYEFTGYKNAEFSCPNCNEPLQIASGKFARITPPGTIDVDAVEVSVQTIEADD